MPPRDKGTKNQRTLRSGNLYRPEDILASLGLQATPTAVLVLAKQKVTPQLPDVPEVLSALQAEPEVLREAMEAAGITTITHAEGLTLWDHTEATIREADKLDIPEEDKALLKTILLYHDQGKTEVGEDGDNPARTAEKLAAGEMLCSMVGHERASLDVVEAGFREVGVDDPELCLFVVRNHMQTEMLQNSPKKTFALFDEMPEENHRRAAELLALAIQMDGRGTRRVTLEDGRLTEETNAGRGEFAFETIWNTYQEGKRLRAEQEEKQRLVQEQDAREHAIFGSKLSEWLMSKGVPQGPELGKAMGRARKIISGTEGLSPEELQRSILAGLKEQS